LFCFFNLFLYLPAPSERIIAHSTAAATDINTSTPESTTISRAHPVTTAAAIDDIIITVAVGVSVTEWAAIIFTLCLFHLGRGSYRWSDYDCRLRFRRSCKNRKLWSWFLLTRVNTLATTFNRTEWIELYQVGSNNTLGTSDMSAGSNLLRALRSILSGHNFVTGCAAIRLEPALWREPELAILASVLVRLVFLIFALDRFEASRA
jgi:hypothetical protein